MKNKTLGIISLLIIIILRVFWKFFPFASIESNLKFLLVGVGIVASTCFFYWLTKYTNFFKKVPLGERAEHRLKTAEKLGFISTIIYIGYILGFISLGVGIFSLFLNRTYKFEMFLILAIFGLVMISITRFFVKRHHKNVLMRQPGFEPGSLAWKARVLTRLDY